MADSSLKMRQKKAVFILLWYLFVTSQADINDESRLIIFPQQTFLNAYAGQPLSLSCIGQPPDGFFTDFKWLNPNREEIPQGNPGVQNISRNVLNLMFLNPTPKDSGNYKCIAKHGSDIYLEEEVQILFIEDIRFENCSAKQDLYYNEFGHILCNPVSNRELSVVWTKDNKKLPQSDRFALTAYGITINEVNDNDAGLYLLEVFESTTGVSRSKSIEVEVLHKDNGNNTGKLDEVFIKEVSKDIVQFEIRTSNRVDSIDVQYKESLGDQEETMSWKIGDPYKVHNLVPSGQYRFQFRTRPLTSTRWTKSLVVTTLPGVPEVILKSLSGGVIEIEWTRSVNDMRRSTINMLELSYQPIKVSDSGWIRSNCSTNIAIPTSYFGSSYKIVDLKPGAYEVRAAARTSSGSGDPYTVKIKV